MCKKLSTILSLMLITSFIILSPIRVNADHYTLNELIENSKLLDEKEVRVDGEAIGEELGRGKYSWININDTTNAIGIYMTKKDSLKIKIYGGYKKVGDKINVVGIFNRACEEHGGDMDIHAKEVNVIEKGRELEMNFQKEKIIATIVLPIITLILAYVSYKKSKK